MTDITELAQRARINAECGEHLSPAETIELVEALEKAQETIAFQQGEIKALLSSLESRTVKLPLPSCTYADHSYPAYTKQQVLTMLESLGVTVVEEDV
ncbi:hypothetical protein [Klebsiella quasipneumoniae]|uniref:hypothetical protein n=1 Tax=Klebsiella quasipneumoniae TaxID=1463165 RepID=UPI0024816E51|nr:hypothetical protein [Klebsiella quasipneumoniae]